MIRSITATQRYRWFFFTDGSDDQHESRARAALQEITRDQREATTGDFAPPAVEDEMVTRVLHPNALNLADAAWREEPVDPWHGQPLFPSTRR